MLRKYKYIVIVTLAALFLSGCGIKEKVEENITEKIIENAAGDDVNVDIDGDEISYSTDEGEVSIDEKEGVTFEGEDGSTVTSGGVYEWPEDQAAAYLPKYDKGELTYILNSEDVCMLLVEKVSIKDYESYVKTIIDKGYTANKIESTAEDTSFYSAASEEGNTVSVCFYATEENIQITLDTSGSKQ